MKTVNVIALIDGKVISLEAFADNAEGNAQAEDLFKRLVNEHLNDHLNEVNGNDREPAITLDEADMQTLIEDGAFDDDQGYEVLLVHST